MTEPICALVVEDLPTDAELIVAHLEEDGFAVAWQRVDTEQAFLAAIATRPDVVLADWRLPRFSGLRALELLREATDEIPFVIVSGIVGEEAAVDAMKAGADDYVLKDRLARLGPAVRGAIERRQLRSERRQAEAGLRLAAAVFESSTEGVLVTDAQGTILAVNRAFTEITGYEPVEVIGSNPRLLQSGRQDVTFYRDMWATLLRTGRWCGEIWNRRRDGRIYPELLTISAVKAPDGTTLHYAGVFGDTGDVKEAQAAFEFLAHHDALTGLPNRTLMLDRLGQAMRRATARDEGIAVLCLDLDAFGAVNDVFGLPVGDALLQAVAGRLSEQVGSRGSLGRYGADEFVIVLEGLSGPEQSVDVVRHLQGCVAMPFTVEGHEVAITCTVGISLFPGDDPDPVTLLRHAETAMRQARLTGREAVGFFDQRLAGELEARLDLGRQLREAVEGRQLSVHYQPILRFDDGTLAGVEALARWHHPERGLIPPTMFIPIAEELGLIDQLGSWVLDTACRQLAAWDAIGLCVPRLSVNLSAHQLQRADLPQVIADVLATTGVPPERLELEVTESMVMRNPARSAEVLAAIHAMGVEIAMDDFGTGHSSLAQLKWLPLHRLKIDLGFVHDIGADRRSEAIIRATVVLAQSLGIETVAEGIETAGQDAFLRLVGCDLAQGFLYGRPVPAPEFTRSFASRAGAQSAGVHLGRRCRRGRG